MTPTSTPDEDGTARAFHASKWKDYGVRWGPERGSHGGKWDARDDDERCKPFSFFHAASNDPRGYLLDHRPCGLSTGHSMHYLYEVRAGTAAQDQ